MVRSQSDFYSRHCVGAGTLGWIFRYGYQRLADNSESYHAEVPSLAEASIFNDFYIVIDFDYIITSGDLNLHVDNPENSYTEEVNALLVTV